MRHGVLSTRSLFREGRYSICELPDGEIKGRYCGVASCDGEIVKSDLFRGREGRIEKKKIRENVSSRSLSDVFGAAARGSDKDRKVIIASRGSSCYRYKLIEEEIGNEKEREWKSDGENEPNLPTTREILVNREGANRDGGMENPHKLERVYANR